LGRIGSRRGVAGWVTVPGPGGVGKTRLAVEVAARAAGEACFVDLALLSDGAQVPGAVLGALGLREAGLLPLAPGMPDPAGRLVTALTNRQLLLLLDNCAHLVGAAALLPAGSWAPALTCRSWPPAARRSASRARPCTRCHPSRSHPQQPAPRRRLAPRRSGCLPTGPPRCDRASRWTPATPVRSGR